MDLTQIKTTSGKTIVDFKIPAAFIEKEPNLVKLVMESDSMNDDERQYWFNLTEVMDEAQVEKLRDILTRERQKLDEINAKYHPEKVDPVEAAKKAQELAAKRSAQQAALKTKEAEDQDKEKADEAAILAELEAL